MTATPERPLTPDPPAPPGDNVEAPDIHFSRPDQKPDPTDSADSADGTNPADGAGGTVPAEQDVNTDAVSPEPPD